MTRQIEKQIFDRLLLKFGEQRDNLPNDKLTAFFAMKGYNYSGELMIVGRAVNGWETEWKLEDVLEQSKRLDIIERSLRNSDKEERCPMLWVTDKWSEYTYKSAFWRVIKSITGKLNIADINKNDWPSYLLWSNLYKVAPSERGNPRKVLKDIQKAACRELLMEEINQWNPKRILFLTGINWAEDFLKNMGIIDPGLPNNLVQLGKGIQLGNTYTKIVVAKHPQFKPEDKWVEEVINTFQSL